MKLYSLDGPAVVEDPDYGTFTTGDDDALVGLPDELYARLHRTYVAGKKVWENEEERDARLVSEEDARRRDPATLLAAVERMGAPRELTAAELREAYEERKRIREEEEARELARLEAVEKSEAANIAAKEQAEAERIDELPVHVGDTVKLNEAAIAAEIAKVPDVTPEQSAKVAEWRGVVESVYRDEDGDDVASIVESEIPVIPIQYLTVVDVEAERVAAEQAEADAKARQEKADADAAEQERIAKEAEDAKKNAPAGDGTAAPKPPAKSAKATASK